MTGAQLTRPFTDETMFLNLDDIITTITLKRDAQRHESTHLQQSTLITDSYMYIKLSSLIKIHVFVGSDGEFCSSIQIISLSE